MMLLNDKRMIGNKLFALRKQTDKTQLELAVASELSERTYADIERGQTDMRVSTLLKLCQTLHVTPDEILTDPADESAPCEDEMFARLAECSSKDRETALKLLKVYLQSLT